MGRWLSLSEASGLLGVHASTLRRWADSGRVPCQRTPGGHRRFSRHQLMPLLDGAVNQDEELAGQGEVEQQPWHRAFADAGCVPEMREIGQRLSGILLQHMMREPVDARYAEQARLLGGQYASATLAAGIPLPLAVEAFSYYRASLSQLAAQGVTDTKAARKAFVRYESIMAEVLRGLVAGYEDA